MDSFFAFLASIEWWGWPLIVLSLIAIKDIFFNYEQTKKHNFPVAGHLRYFLEEIGPELRQYIVASNRAELPFNQVERGVMAFALGANCINVARETMMSIGCIQAQACHNNTGPTGITTQNKWLQAGINVKDKARRGNYLYEV